MFAVNDKLAVFLGKHSIYGRPLPMESHISDLKTFDISLVKNLPIDKKLEQISGATLSMSSNGRYIVVADNFKNVHLFEHDKNTSTWGSRANWIMDRQVIKVGVDPMENYVIILDKCGDIYASLIGPNHTSDKIKILGHTSFVLDMAITQDSQHIITCDRDEKIRIAAFPLAYNIEMYLLGHTAGVINIGLVNSDENLISASVDGVIMLWQKAVNNSGKTFGGYTLAAKWNVFEILGEECQECQPNSGADQHQLVKMSATFLNGRLFVAILIAGSSKFRLFEIFPLKKKFELILEDRIDHDVVDMTWVQGTLYIFCPVMGTLKTYVVPPPNDTLFQCEVLFNPAFDDKIKADLSAYGSAQVPTVTHLQKSIKGRWGHEDVDGKNKTSGRSDTRTLQVGKASEICSMSLNDEESSPKPSKMTKIEQIL